MPLRILSSLILLCTYFSVQSQCFLVPSEVCLGSCGPVFYLQDDPPGTLYDWSIDCGTITNDTLSNPHTVCFMSTGICTIQVIIQIPGEDPDTCTHQVNVLPPSLSVLLENVCANDSIEINGTYYSEGFYIDTINGGAVNGCDSILFITIADLPADTTHEDYVGCNGDGYSVIVNGATYNESNPSGIEFLTGSDGCDSVVIINLLFQDPVTGNETYTGCEGDGYQVIVNGTIYNESNPTGTETFTGSNGCDSTVTIALTFLPLSQTTITYMGCSGDGYSIMVGDILFDENNPSGIFILSGSLCDSIITVDLHFDTLVASFTLNGHQLCVEPAGMQYRWYTCDSIQLADTTSCITLDSDACICVIVDNGTCQDTICDQFIVCNLACDIIAPAGACTGDSILLTASSNASDTALWNWTITTGSGFPLEFSSTDSVYIEAEQAGSIVIDLQIQELGCFTSCNDTITVTDRPLAALCCTDMFCDSAFLTVTLFGQPPFSFAITDGISIDTFYGITSSQYEFRVYPPFMVNTLYTLLWVQDSSANCFGGIINDSAFVYLVPHPVITIVQTGNTLCIEPTGFAYNWTDCETPVTLAPGRCFTPTASGCYCAHLSTGIIGCSDMECIDFVLTDVDEPREEPASIWYNFTEHAIFIRIHNNTSDDLQFQLYDLQGRDIAFNEKEQIDEGLYRIILPDNAPHMVIASVLSPEFRYTRGVFVTY